MEQSIGNGPVLALYDFRSKQEFIYRTNKMREITGGSELIARMYEEFLKLDLSGGAIRNDWRDERPRDLFDAQGMPVLAADEAGAVVYEGGGNLCILFRDRQTYVEANRVFTLHVLRRGYTLNLITGCAEWDAELSFVDNLARMHRALDANKRIGYAGGPCNVLPFTQVDRSSFQAINEQDMRELFDDYSRWGHLWERSYRAGDGTQLSRESKVKLGSFFRKACEDESWLKQGQHVDEIGTESGDSLVAVVYFDGNSIGDALKQRGTDLQGMRSFSKEVHKVLVEIPEAAMKTAIESMPDEKHRGYRIIIDHGDEITLICNAHAAPIALDAYFGAIEGTGYQACAGMAICHSHDPFSEVYKIAEECCESGKKANRARIKLCGSAEDRKAANASYIDFHFCRSGITGTLEQIRDAQEDGLHARPYRVLGNDANYREFIQMGSVLADSNLTRGDLKQLNRAILKGESWYQLECERLKAKDSRFAHVLRMLRDDRLTKRFLYDITSFWDVFDVRFSESTHKGVDYAGE